MIVTAEVGRRAFDHVILLYSHRSLVRRSLAWNSRCFTRTCYSKESTYEPSRYAVPHASSKSWPSTAPTVDEFELDALDPKHNEQYSPPPSPSVLAATPREYAGYFPSPRRLTIMYDAKTENSNMNLRIEVAIRTANRPQIDLTPFYLQMHDLKGGVFSSWRYCRESGKEICQSKLKETKSLIIRPGLRRSMSSALSNLRSKSGTKTTTVQHMRRQDSNYGSTSDDEIETSQNPSCTTKGEISRKSSSFMALEFSNYAHLEINRKETRSSKR